MISVIIPLHNRFLLVDEAVRSVFKQTYRPIKLILVDDHSDVPYKAAIPDGGHEGFEVITLRHEVNQGPGEARETGRKIAKGDYIAYLDSDELWHPQKLEKQVSALRANPQAGMCYCSSVVFSKLPLTGGEPLRKRSDQAFDRFLPAILSGRPWPTSACLWTREASEIIGPWSDGWSWEDYEYDCRAGCNDIPIIFLPETLCYVRVEHGEDQLSRSQRNKVILRRNEALLRMSAALDKYGKMQNNEIRTGFGRLIYFQAMHLFYLGERQQGLQMLSEYSKMSGGWKMILSRIMIGISPLIGSQLLGHLSYKMRHYISRADEIDTL